MELLSSETKTIMMTAVAHTKKHSRPYEFSYKVRDAGTGDFKTHQEVSDGQQVRGMYSLGEPNGDLRMVSYTADKDSGFRAAVRVYPSGSPMTPIYSYDNVEQQSPEYIVSTNIKNHNQEDHTNYFYDKMTLPSVTEVSHENQDIENHNLKKKSNKTLKYELEQSSISDAIDTDLGRINKATTEDQEETTIMLQETTPQDKNRFEVKNYFAGNSEGKDYEQVYLKTADYNTYQGSKNIPVIIQVGNLSSNLKSNKSETQMEMSAYNSTFYSGEHNTKNKTSAYHQDHQKGLNYTQIKVLGNKTDAPYHNLKEQFDLSYSQIKVLGNDTNVHYHDHKKQISPDYSQIRVSDSEQKEEHIHPAFPTIKAPGFVSDEERVPDSLKIKNTEGRGTIANKTEDTKYNINIINDLRSTTAHNLSVSTLILDSILTKDKETIHNKTQNIEKQQDVNIKNSAMTSKINNNENKTEKGSNIMKEENYNVKTKQSEQIHNNNLILTTLLLPTANMLKFTCYPDKLVKDDSKLVPTLSTAQITSSQENPPQKTPQFSQKTLFTSSIPFYPIHLVKMQAVKNADYSSEPEKQFTFETPSSFSSQGTQNTLIDGTTFERSRAPLPQQIFYSEHLTDENLEASTPSKEISRHTIETNSKKTRYPHHSVPLFWTHQPHISHVHSSLYKHMPIFVLPMSHNFNFAPTFNPKAFNEHNQ